MNQKEQEKVERIKKRIIARNYRKSFSETKVGILLTRDWIEYLVDKTAHHMYLKQVEKESKERREKLLKEGFTGDPNNYDEVLKYEQAIGSEPIESYQDEEGVWTHIYPDGNKVRVKVTLSSIFPSKEAQDEVLEYLRKKDDDLEKQEFSKYIGLSDEEIINLSWEEIDEKILSSSKPKTKVKRMIGVK